MGRILSNFLLMAAALLLSSCVYVNTHRAAIDRGQEYQAVILPGAELHADLLGHSLAVANAKAGEVAFTNNTQWRVEGKGCNKELVIEKPKAGKWFISVLCTTAVGSFVDEFGTTYLGRTDVLNGVPYSVKATLF